MISPSFSFQLLDLYGHQVLQVVTRVEGGARNHVITCIWYLVFNSCIKFHNSSYLVTEHKLDDMEGNAVSYQLRSLSVVTMTAVQLLTGYLIKQETVCWHIGPLPKMSDCTEDEVLQNNFHSMLSSAALVLFNMNEGDSIENWSGRVVGIFLHTKLKTVSSWVKELDTGREFLICPIEMYKFRYVLCLHRTPKRIPTVKWSSTFHSGEQLAAVQKQITRLENHVTVIRPLAQSELCFLVIFQLIGLPRQPHIITSEKFPPRTLVGRSKEGGRFLQPSRGGEWITWLQFLYCASHYNITTYLQYNYLSTYLHCIITTYLLAILTVLPHPR